MQPVSSSEREVHRVNVLEIIGSSTLGGMENYITNFIQHLPANNFRLTCICPNESPFTATLRKLGVEAVYISPIADDPPWRSIQMAVEASRLHKIDILHGHMPKAHVLAGLAGRLVNKPILATVHGMDVTAHEYGVCRAVESSLVTNCQEAYFQALALGAPPERVTHIRNGVDTAVFTTGRSGDKLRKTLDILPGTPLVGFVGRLEHVKGPDLFLRAADRVHQVLPDVQFVIVGQGSMLNELRMMCKQMQLTQHVHFLGWSAQTEEVYPALDLVVHSSRSDGTSLVLLEAMACGCPAIGLSVGGIREIIEDPSTGLLLAAGDWEGLAAGVINLLKQPETLKNMGTAARKRVEQYFDVRTNTAKVAELLRRLAFPATAGKLIANKTPLAS